MGNKIHLACWKGDTKALKYYTDNEWPWCSQQYRRPDVFGVHPVHILVFRKHADESLWYNVFYHMDSSDAFNVTFGGISAADLAEGDSIMLGRLSRFNSFLRARHLYRFGGKDMDNWWIACFVLGNSDQRALMEAIPSTLGPNTTNKPIRDGIPLFITPLFVAVLANDLPFLNTLLSQGAKPSMQPPTSEGNYGLIHLAARLDRHRLIPVLIRAGCAIDTDAASVYGSCRTPLVIASHYGNLRSIKALANSPGFDLQSSKGVNALFAAAQEGQFHVIPTLVKLGCRVDECPDSSLVAPLHVAAIGDHAGAVETLLRLGANPFGVSSRGDTALHFAAEGGSSNVIPILVQSGLSPYEPEGIGGNIRNPFHTAILLGQLGLLNTLVNSNCSLRHDVLHIALSFRFYLMHPKDPVPPVISKKISIHFLSGLIKLGCSITAVDESTGFLPIHLAAHNNDPAVIQLLINYKSPKNVFTKSSDGERMTPLQIAAKNNSVAAIEVLVANGCNVDFHHPLEEPPLHLAISHGSLEAVKALLKHRANASLRNHYGLLPVHTAIRCNQTEVIEILSEHGANLSLEYDDLYSRQAVGEIYNQFRSKVNLVYSSNTDYISSIFLPCSDISTPNDEVVRKFLKSFMLEEHFFIAPLTFAVTSNSRAAVKKLLELGACVPDELFFDSDPLSLACRLGFPGIVEELIDHGFDKDALDASGFRAIHTAIKYNQPDVVQTLIDKGCDFGSPTLQHGRPDLTPFQFASIMCCPRILGILHRVAPDAVNQLSPDKLSPLHLALITPSFSHDFADGRVRGICVRIEPTRQEETVKQLLGVRCNVNATDEEGLTPLDLALHYESQRIVYLLTKADGEKGKKIKDKEAMKRRIAYLEQQVGSAITTSTELTEKVHYLEGRLESLKQKTNHVDTRLKKVEADQQKYLNLCSEMIDVHFGKCLIV